MKCLLAAESMILRRIFHNAVESFDFEEIMEATDGKQAFALCDEETSVVITARDLPLIDGLELTKKIRESEGSSGTRVLMIAERKSREDLLKAAQAGVNGYMVKPLSLQTLRAKIERLLQVEEEKSEESASEEDTSEERNEEAEAA